MSALHRTWSIILGAGEGSRPCALITLRGPVQ